MSNESEFSVPIPEKLFIVVCDDKYRIYVREGQATNWFSKKVNEGRNPRIYSFTKEPG